MEIHQVLYLRGEYSDKSESVVFTSLSKEKAEEFCNKANAAILEAPVPNGWEPKQFENWGRYDVYGEYIFISYTVDEDEVLEKLDFQKLVIDPYKPLVELYQEIYS